MKNKSMSIDLPMLRYSIRIAEPVDETKIRELFLEMLQSIYPKENVKGYQDGDLDRFWGENENRIYVADADEVIAFLSVEVHHEPESYIYLDDFSVTETYRNKGIGTQLINTAEAYARKKGIPAVFLHAEKTNRSAMCLYARLGYSMVKDEGHRILLKKELTPGETSTSG